MSENKFVYRAIKAAQVAPTSATPAVQSQVKCDTVIRTGDTIFMYIKDK